MSNVSLDRQVACVLREISMRERVYPHWVGAGKMRQDKADEEIAAMRAVLETLRALAYAHANVHAGQLS